MSEWRATRARQVLAALLRIGRRTKRQSGSHRVLARAGWPDVVVRFTTATRFGRGSSLGIARATGLRPDDL